MVQSSGCPQEALGTGADTAADSGLRLTNWTEDLAWPGTQKKKKKVLNPVLQSCPIFDALRRQAWPSPVDAHRKLWGTVEILR